MDLPCLTSDHLPEDHRGARAHRFMESADIGCAFREIFRATRTNLRRGLHTHGQWYALEMDDCIPGELLDTVWLPAVAHGLSVDDGGEPSDGSGAARSVDSPGATRARHEQLRRLLARPAAPALLVWVGERTTADGRTVLRTELASADGLYVAEHRVGPGRGWRRRELLRDPHRRCDIDAMA